MINNKFDENKKPVDCEIQRTFRKDVIDVFKEYPVQDSCGFYCTFQGISGKHMYLVMRDAEGAKSVTGEVVIQKVIKKDSIYRQNDLINIEKRVFSI